MNLGILLLFLTLAGSVNVPLRVGQSTVVEPVSATFSNGSYTIQTNVTNIDSPKAIWRVVLSANNAIYNRQAPLAWLAYQDNSTSVRYDAYPYDQPSGHFARGWVISKGQSNPFFYLLSLTLPLQVNWCTYTYSGGSYKLLDCSNFVL